MGREEGSRPPWRAQAAEPQGGSAVRAGRPLARRCGASLPGAGGERSRRGAGAAPLEDGRRPEQGRGGAVVAGRGRGGSKRERERPRRTDVASHVGGQTRSKGFWTSSDTLK